jgi:hypothetical protein
MPQIGQRLCQYSSVSNFTPVVERNAIITPNAKCRRLLGTPRAHSSDEQANALISYEKWGQHKCGQTVQLKVVCELTQNAAGRGAYSY